MDAMTYDAKLRARAETLATTCIHGGDGAVPYGATDVPVVFASAFRFDDAETAAARDALIRRNWEAAGFVPETSRKNAANKKPRTEKN